jgi:hypothetical protein
MRFLRLRLPQQNTPTDVAKGIGNESSESWRQKSEVKVWAAQFPRGLGRLHCSHLHLHVYVVPPCVSVPQCSSPFSFTCWSLDEGPSICNGLILNQPICKDPISK